MQFPTVKMRRAIAVLALTLIVGWRVPTALAQDAALDLDVTASLDGSCPGSQVQQVAPGVTVTYCFHVTNSGSTYLIGISVTDDRLGAICTIAGPLAPDAEQTCSQAAVVSSDVVNVGTATGTPSDSTGQSLGLPPIDLSDDVQVDVLTPGISVGKTVYLGHSAGADCPASLELVSSTTGTAISYCFVVINSGEAGLANLTLADPTLGIDRSDMVLLAGSEPLAPGATATFFYETLLAGDLTNTVTVSGSPLDDAGAPLPGGASPSDSDSAQVDAVSPSVTLDKTVSADGMCPGSETLQVAPGATVTYCYRLTNSGDSSLANLLVTDDRLGFVCGLRGPLEPGGLRLCTRTTTIAVDTVNVGAVTATPSDTAGLPLPGLAPVSDSDDAVVDVLVPATTCVGDTIFFDLDNDGRFEPAQGEFGLAGVAVSALVDSDASGGLSAGDTPAGAAVTGAGGGFHICSLVPGDYVVQVDPGNFDPGGLLDGLVSSAGNDVAGVTPDPDDDVDHDDNGRPAAGGGVATRALTLSLGGEPAAAADGDGTDSNSTVDLGFIRVESPTGLRLTSLSLVTGLSGELRLEWGALSEEAILGYAAQRADHPDGPWSRVDQRLQPAGPGRAQHQYRAIDRPGPGAWYYRLEVVGADGATEYYGPLLARAPGRWPLFFPRLTLTR